jgi:hypothetical protein
VPGNDRCGAVWEAAPQPAPKAASADAAVHADAAASTRRALMH